MDLSIKNAEAHRLASRLAELTGTSMTAAVIDALQKRLEEEENKKPHRRATAEELMEIGRQCAQYFDDTASSQDHDALLYDPETGLPREK